MEKKISNIYSEAESDITEKWTEYMAKSESKISEYKIAYDNAVKVNDKELIKETKSDLQNALKNQTLRNDYYNDMLDSVTTKISNTNVIALAYVNNQMPSIYLENFNFINKDTEKLITNNGIKFNLIDEAVVKRRVKDGDIKLPKKKVKIPKDKQWNTKQLNSSVLQGIIQGESMNDIAKRILPIVDNNKTSAIRNARTMVTGAENQGRLDRYKDLEERGAVIKKVWMATGDGRTRDWHLEMDGQEQDLDDPFIDGLGNELEMPGDASAPAETVYNCRCTTTSKILGFKKSDGSVKYIDYEQKSTKHDEEIQTEKEKRNQ